MSFLKSNRSIFKCRTAAIAAAALFLPGLAFGQGATSPLVGQSMPSNGVQAATPTLPTNLAGIRLVPPPPAGFDPLTASAGELQKYAVPPAPNAAVNPRAYAEWQRAVSGPKNQPMAPVVSQTSIKNGSVKLAPNSSPLGKPSSSVNTNAGEVSNSAIAANSYNWSGPAFYDKSNPFKVSAIIGEFTVPTVQQAFGSCDGGWDYSSNWAGIDGFGSSDVLQAGIEADAYCKNGSKSTLYSAWIEWYPFNETRVSAPSIKPGDVVFVEVWNVSPTVGYAYLYDFSNLSYGIYQLTAPSGTTLVGTSAEWVVERPGVGGGLATLANYIDSSWPYNIAWTYAAAKPAYYYPGSAPTSGTTSLYSLTMLDNSGKPISSGEAENFDFLFFRNFGSSIGTGTSPYGFGTNIAANGAAGSP